MTFISNFLKIFKQMLLRYHEKQVSPFLDLVMGHGLLATSFFFKLIFQSLFFEQAFPVKYIAQCQGLSVRAFSLFFSLLKWVF